jgi:hypothetical protein
MDKGDYKMKKLLFGTILLALVQVFSVPAMAGVDVGISVSLPPLIVFAAPPEVVVIPETYVYAVPDSDVDLFFYSGWWWRPWEGRWYRSRHYNSGWAYYQNVPSFYREIPPGWRNDYRNHRWKGHQWNYQRIPHQQVQGNWSNWEKNRHWEKQNTWGVQGLKPQTRSHQPYQEAQSKSHGKQQYREAPQPQQSRPQSQGKPQHRETYKSQQSQPQSREVKPNHPQHQKNEAPQNSNPGHGKPGKGEKDKQDKK